MPKSWYPRTDKKEKFHVQLSEIERRQARLGRIRAALDLYDSSPKVPQPSAGKSQQLPRSPDNAIASPVPDEVGSDLPLPTPQIRSVDDNAAQTSSIEPDTLDFHYIMGGSQNTPIGVDYFVERTGYAQKDSYLPVFT